MADTPETPPEHVGYAVIVDGPIWWGDTWSTVDARPIGPRDEETKARRRDEAADELRGLNAILETIPADCVVFHTGARGAAVKAADWATKNGHLVVAIPSPPGSTVSVDEKRNSLAASVVSGLRASGYKVKAVLCWPTRAYGDTELGTLPHLVEELRRRDVNVKLAHPVPPPEPEPETPPAG